MPRGLSESPTGRHLSRRHNRSLFWRTVSSQESDEKCCQKDKYRDETSHIVPIAIQYQHKHRLYKLSQQTLSEDFQSLQNQRQSSL